jgi:hypothetical protein
MASSQFSNPIGAPIIIGSGDLINRTPPRSRGRRLRSLSSKDDEYAALYAYPGRRRRSRSRSRSSARIVHGAQNSHLPRPDFKYNILLAYRRGIIHRLERLLHDASLVPARPDEMPTTDEMVLEILEAPHINILRIVIRRDPSYQWSGLVILTAIEKDKLCNPPVYLDIFLFLGLSPFKVWDQETDNYDALMWAIRSSSPKFIALLLSTGADPNGAKVGGQF